MKRRHPLPLCLLALALLLGVIWLSAALGSREGKIILEPGWIGALLGGENQPLLYWRLPRALAALVVGAALAVAGLVLQGLTRNPLADPYLLGISGGAGLAVVALHALPALVAWGGWYLLPVSAFLGAQGAALLVFLLARASSGSQGQSILGLILSGVVVNALCAAIMTFMLVRFDPLRLRITTVWLAGGVGYTPWNQLGLVATIALAAWFMLCGQAHRLNAFALGTHGASAVGVDTQRLLVRAALLASLLTGLAVSVGGLLGYVGLIVPHAVRRVVGNDLRRSMTLTALSGALLVAAADVAARLVLAPEELPVGVLTAFLGCPVLLLLLKRQLRSGGA